MTIYEVLNQLKEAKARSGKDIMIAFCTTEEVQTENTKHQTAEAAQTTEEE